MDPKISIIMPAYNAENHIRDSINSVIEQHYTNWELIVVNDKSLDSTKQIIQEYVEKDNRIHFINNEVNLGVAKARNVAIDFATGNYIAFLDSDDLWDRNKLLEQVSFASDNNYAFTFTAFRTMNGNGELSNKIFDAPKVISYKELLKTCYMGCLTVMVRSDLLKKDGMPLVKAEDYATWLLILKENNINAYGLNKVLASYMIHQSISSNKFETNRWVFNIYRKALNYSYPQSVVKIIKYSFYTFLRKIKD